MKVLFPNGFNTVSWPEMGHLTVDMHSRFDEAAIESVSVPTFVLLMLTGIERLVLHLAKGLAAGRCFHIRTANDCEKAFGSLRDVIDNVSGERDVANDAWQQVYAAAKGGVPEVVKNAIGHGAMKIFKHMYVQIDKYVSEVKKNLAEAHAACMKLGIDEKVENAADPMTLDEGGAMMKLIDKLATVKFKKVFKEWQQIVDLVQEAASVLTKALKQFSQREVLEELAATTNMLAVFGDSDTYRDISTLYCQCAIVQASFRTLKVKEGRSEDREPLVNAAKSCCELHKVQLSVKYTFLANKATKKSKKL